MSVRKSTVASAACAALALTAWSLAGPAPAQPPGDALAAGFATPPASAKPRVWWHWMNGNITKEGIKLDLEWMHRVGIGGFQTFDASRGTPQVVKERLVYMSPQWQGAFGFAIDEAKRLGLDAGIAGSPGWSESGGPWVKPEEAMKKLVWSETAVEGGRAFHGVLARPPTATGPFQDYPFVPDSTAEGHPPPKPTFYADAAVVAYRLPQAAADRAVPSRVTSSAGAIQAGLLNDGEYARAVELPIGDASRPAWILFEYPQRQTIRAVSLAMAADNWAHPQSRRAAPAIARVEVSDDGQTFREVGEVPGFGSDRAVAAQHTVALPETTGRFFRVSFMPPPANADYRTSLFAPDATAAKTHRIVELELLAEPRINRFEEKAGFGTLTDYYDWPTPEAGQGSIRREDVVDLTASMKADGTLDWTPPAGRWTVLRLGYSLIGTTNHPASEEATGLEVDKLSRRDVGSYFNQYLARYEQASGGRLGEAGVSNLVTDSWEAGVSNWTDDMRTQFAARAHYDITPFLPVLTGRVVESAQASERFLWDFRRVIGDMVAENHYGQIAEILHSHGMKQFGESLERERPTLGDGMAFKHLADVPMGAYWVRRAPNEAMPNYAVDVKESASVAHIYGQNFVAAESLTANSSVAGWSDSPRTLKPYADEMLALGLNRFVIHTSVHQPLVDAAPGLTLGIFGQHFNRNDTWAEEAGPWVSYLTRSAYMLQQGLFVADIAYFYGEEAPLTALYQGKTATPPEIPEGYAFDFVNADVLINQLSVKDGRLLAKSGVSYGVLYLGGTSRMMTLAVARRVRDLAMQGATIIGRRPEASPSLADDPAEFKQVVDAVWGDQPGVRSMGLGAVYSAATLGEALTSLQVGPDFDYDNPGGATNLSFVHRRTADADIYFVANKNDRREDVAVSLRTAGREAELWRADTGAITPAPYRIDRGRTTVPVHFDPYGSAFLVFRKPAVSPARQAAPTHEALLRDVDGPWTVSFQPGRGAPPAIAMPRLASLSASNIPGVRYFSGTASYSRSLEVPAAWLGQGKRVQLDLGVVREIAKVEVNGRKVGTKWTPPYRLDVTEALHPGRNTLVVRVTDLWVNRLIGDLQPGAKKITFTVSEVYKPDSPLLPSGLLGPVQVLSVTSP